MGQGGEGVGGQAGVTGAVMSAECRVQNEIADARRASGQELRNDLPYEGDVGLRDSVEEGRRRFLRRNVDDRLPDDRP